MEEPPIYPRGWTEDKALISSASLPYMCQYLVNLLIDLHYPTEAKRVSFGLRSGSVYLLRYLIDSHAGKKIYILTAWYSFFHVPMVTDAAVWHPLEESVKRIHWEIFPANVFNREF